MSGFIEAFKHISEMLDAARTSGKGKRGFWDAVYEDDEGEWKHLEGHQTLNRQPDGSLKRVPDKIVFNVSENPPVKTKLRLWSRRRAFPNNQGNE